MDVITDVSWIASWLKIVIITGIIVCGIEIFNNLLLLSCLILILGYSVKVNNNYCKDMYHSLQRSRYMAFVLLILVISLISSQGWLYRLEQDGSPQAKQLLDRFVARASELKIPVCDREIIIIIVVHS